MMDNLNINRFKFLDNVRYKLIGIGAFVAIGSFVYYYSHKNYNDYSLTSVVEALNEQDSVTDVDNYLLSGVSYDDKNMDLKELDNIFINAYNNGDRATCNSAITAMSTAVLKSQVAEGYSVDFDKIEDFEVIGHLGKVELDDGEGSKSEYGVSFTYNGQEYKLEAEDGIARKLCVIARAGRKGSLLLEDTDENDFKEFVLTNAYEYVKEGVVSELDYDNQDHTFTDYISGYEGYNYDGYFKLCIDPQKSGTVDNNIHNKGKLDLQLNGKTTYTIVEETTKSSKLPVKVK